MKQVTAILIGAGQRGAQVYASYALAHPNELRFVGVAEPDKKKREDFARKHQIPEDKCFQTWEEILSIPKFADCALICTQDREHFSPLEKAAALSYHILCEKPITPVKEELVQIQNLARTHDTVISVAHVLRFSPFFKEIKRIIDGGLIGDIVNVQHLESVGYWHMAHSFVRGNWRNSKESCPMILAKCCHDFDILLWLIGKKCDRVSSFGNLMLFQEKHAPRNSPLRCTDGCEERESCPFYAPRFYLEHPKAEIDGLRYVACSEKSPEAILEALAYGPYGRCVYHCDNDVVDHQIVNMEFEGGITASLTMCAFTDRCERIIDIMGTRGQIHGQMEDNLIVATDFATGNTNRITVRAPEGGHSGSDASMMSSFVKLVASEGSIQDESSALQAIESHLIALAAEESRINHGKLVEIKGFSEIANAGNN